MPDSVSIIPPVLFGKNVKLEKNTTIGQYVTIGDSCVIGEDSEVSNSVLWKNTHILPNSAVNSTISGRHSILCKKNCGAVVADGGLVGERKEDPLLRSIPIPNHN